MLETIHHVKIVIKAMRLQIIETHTLVEVIEGSRKSLMNKVQGFGLSDKTRSKIE